MGRLSITATPGQQALLRRQLLPSEGIVNLRDLGGYRVADGRRVCKGRLLRGGSLAQATDNDLAMLSSTYNVKTVFDFRTDGELQNAPDRRMPGVASVWLPAIDPETEKLGSTSLPVDAYSDLPSFLVVHSMDDVVQKVARGMYVEMVTNEYTQLQYAAFLQMLVSTRVGGFFWHCSQGKDRTGLAAAFLLAALGADRETILCDYELSNVYYIDAVQALAGRVRSIGGDDEAVNVVLTFVGANVAYFSHALDVIDQQYGSMDNYLKGPLCLMDDDIAILRDKFLE